MYKTKTEVQLTQLHVSTFEVMYNWPLYYRSLETRLHHKIPLSFFLKLKPHLSPIYIFFLVRHGWAKVVYTTKSIRAEPIFLVRVLFSSEPCQTFSAV